MWVVLLRDHVRVLVLVPVLDFQRVDLDLGQPHHHDLVLVHVYEPLEQQINKESLTVVSLDLTDLYLAQSCLSVESE